MTESEALGRVIRRERQKRKLSQERLAEMCGLHRNFVGLIERGQRSATIETLFRLATAFGVKPTRLIQWVENELGT